MSVRASFKDKKRIIIKVGSSSLVHSHTGALNLTKAEKLVRILTDIRNEGKDVCLVSSGAIAVGRHAINMTEKPDTVCKMQACASVGQAKLMMAYQRLFSEYDQAAGQILMTKYTILNSASRENAFNTFEEMFRMGIVPIVNENDTISTYEIMFGDNDSLSALVASLTKADLLILLSDIDGVYTDDPNSNPDAKMITFVDNLSDDIMEVGKDTSTSDVGTGGMKTKLSAARIALSAGADMVIASGNDFSIIEKIIRGDAIGTVFASAPDSGFDENDYIRQTMEGKIEDPSMIRKVGI
ncbi:MAG: glutamate 5-kinase [Eubacterium sp.]|nr:glutamate 5-kinase [Eubacterium sp.]